MTEPDTTDPTPAEPEKRGRGPTRPAVRAADLVDDLAETAPSVRARAVAAIEECMDPAVLRTSLRTRRKAWAEQVRAMEADFSLEEDVISFVTRGMALPPLMRSFVVTACNAADAKASPAPEGEGA